MEVTHEAGSRLKREECLRTKHDSAFSPWKVLSGPSDWEDYAMGREGAERYRRPNLPKPAYCTGVYELGVAVWHHKTRQETGKLDSEFIIPVYVGKTDNVRNRIQQYGREGSHLENGNSNCILNSSKITLPQMKPGLFSEMFSKGFSIAFRWAPMENPRDAKKTESELLETFDYAWNKGSNGSRRCNDILRKLNRASETSPFLAKLQFFPEKRTGIKIKAYEPSNLENGLSFYSNSEMNGLLHQIFKFGRSQPRLVVRAGVNENDTSICGVALGHGVICNRQPTEGNKRCAEHRGMKVNGFTSMLLRSGKAAVVVDEFPTNLDLTPVCGVVLDDGSCCTIKPHHGNKGCLEHKGKKTCHSNPQQVKNEKDLPDQEHFLPTTSRGGKNCMENGDKNTSICGVELDGGAFCSRKPPLGRKRCEQHKGMRIKETISISFKEQIPRVSESSRRDEQNRTRIPSLVYEKGAPTCGAALKNGLLCSRKPSEGNERCWQHMKSPKETISISFKEQIPRVSESSRRDDRNRTRNPSPFYEKSSPTCGAALKNGLPCSRKPSKGNERCWQHM